MLLNKQQMDAVLYTYGPCLVIAGAGSGKTRVITEKIVHLIANCGYKSSEVCAVTFTNKAAKEMKERISLELSAEQIKGLRVSTFHSLGLEIIRNEFKTIGLRKGFSLFDEYDQHSVIKEILQKFSANDTSEEIKEKVLDCSNKISKFKNDLLTPDEVLALANDDYTQFFGLIYKEYQECLNSYNAIDFDDLIFIPVKLFERNEIVRSRWSRRIQYLLVDEYQDTNLSQYKLIKLLVKEHQHFTVVGDDDQSIYSWRGARPQNIPLLKQDFPNLKVIMLEQNYRSKGIILHCANALISNNQHEYEKKLYSELDYGSKIRVIEIAKSDEEGRKLVADIISHHYVKGTRYQDYAILYRGNYQSVEIEKALQESNIPYRIVGGQSFFSQVEVKDFMCYLRTLATNDNRAFLRIINIPRREIGPVAISHLTELADKYKLSLLEACLDSRVQSELKPKEAEKFTNFGYMIQNIRGEILADTKNSVIAKLSELTGYDKWLKSEASSEKSAEIKSNHVDILLDWVTKSMTEDGLDFDEAVQKISLRELLDRNEQDFELDEVQLMTLHSSKGLEFPYVYMIGMEEGLLPHKNSIESGDIDEERRLAYVGITRARNELTFLVCKERKTRIAGNNQSKQKVEPSRFLDELPKEDLDWKRIEEASTQKDIDEAANNAMAVLRALFPNK